MQVPLTDLEHGQTRDLQLELQPPAESSHIRNPLEAGFKVTCDSSLPACVTSCPCRGLGGFRFLLHPGVASSACVWCAGAASLQRSEGSAVQGVRLVQSVLGLLVGGSVRKPCTLHMEVTYFKVAPCVLLCS